MSVLPWPGANAVLLDLRGPAQMDDYGNTEGGGGAPLWAGELEAQLQRERKTVISGGTNTPVEFDVLIVRQPPELIAKARPGDEGTSQTVLVRDERTPTPVESRFRLSKVEHRGKGEAESVRFELSDEEV